MLRPTIHPDCNHFAFSGHDWPWRIFTRRQTVRLPRDCHPPCTEEQMTRPQRLFVSQYMIGPEAKPNRMAKLLTQVECVPESKLDHACVSMFCPSDEGRGVPSALTVCAARTSADLPASAAGAGDATFAASGLTEASDLTAASGLTAVPASPPSTGLVAFSISVWLSLIDSTMASASFSVWAAATD